MPFFSDLVKSQNIQRRGIAPGPAYSDWMNSRPLKGAGRGKKKATKKKAPAASRKFFPPTEPKRGFGLGTPPGPFTGH